MNKRYPERFQYVNPNSAIDNLSGGFGYPASGAYIDDVTYSYGASGVTAIAEGSLSYIAIG